MDSTNKTLFKKKALKLWGLYESDRSLGAGLEAVYEEALEKEFPFKHSL
jgi:hypothetical protein